MKNDQIKNAFVYTQKKDLMSRVLEKVQKKVFLLTVSRRVPAVFLCAYCSSTRSLTPRHLWKSWQVKDDLYLLVQRDELEKILLYCYNLLYL